MKNSTYLLDYADLEYEMGDEEQTLSIVQDIVRGDIRGAFNDNFPRFWIWQETRMHKTQQGKEKYNEQNGHTVF